MGFWAYFGGLALPMVFEVWFEASGLLELASFVLFGV